MTKTIFAFFALFTIFVLALAPEARADLTITPVRVVFGPRDRSTTVVLLNISDKTNTYRFGWIYLKAIPQGGYEKVSNPKADDPFAVSNMVIYSPRQVTIQPGGHQLVRLQLRRPANLPPGEYRAHLTMTQLAAMGPEAPDPNAKSVGLDLKANLSFSIPIIVRQGEDRDLKVALSDPQLKTEGAATVLKVKINRVAGKFSTYGVVKVYWHPPTGEEKQIGAMNNVALYPEVNVRPLVIPIVTKENITGGSIRVVYDGKYESEGTKWAESTFPVGGK